MTTPIKKIELRKISHSQRLSEETPAYAAQVWVDGAHICDVSNHGTGGCDECHPAKGKTHADIEALEAYIKVNHAPRYTGMVLEGKPFIIEPDLETVCGDLLTEHLLAKDLQRLLKRTIAYYNPQTKAIMSFKGKHEGVARAHLITETIRKHPDAKVLNNLPFHEALEIFKADSARA